MNSRERFLAAVDCQPTDRPPIWFMRQAGRYLPEYRALRQQHTFPTLITTPELATEVTLQPLRRFELDAAILFSDILVIPEALGQPYHFREKEGIAMAFTLDTPEAIQRLDPTAIEEKLAYVPAALRLLRRELGDDKALIGFCGAPWTLAAYMLEGCSNPHFGKAKTFALTQPQAFESLLETLTQALSTYLRLQFEAGVDAVQIFDSWAAAVPGPLYTDWSLKWIQRLISKLPSRCPVILFAKGRAHDAAALAATGSKVLSIDAAVQLSDLRRRLTHPVALQGNLDPIYLMSSPTVVRKATQGILNDMAPFKGHIFNLGHGILPEAKLACVEAMVETVHTYLPGTEVMDAALLKP